MTAIPQTNNAKIMKTKDIFGIAALAIMMAACSSDDTTEPQPSQNGKAIPFVALAGESEIAEGKITLKNMTTGEQKLLTPDELINEIL